MSNGKSSGLTRRVAAASSGCVSTEMYWPPIRSIRSPGRFASSNKHLSSGAKKEIDDLLRVATMTSGVETMQSLASNHFDIKRAKWRKLGVFQVSFHRSRTVWIERMNYDHSREFPNQQESSDLLAVPVLPMYLEVVTMDWKSSRPAKITKLDYANFVFFGYARKPICSFIANRLRVGPPQTNVAQAETPQADLAGTSQAHLGYYPINIGES